MQLFYQLQSQDPYIIAQTASGETYKIHINTGSSYQKQGDNFLPIPGCPIPERLWWANFLFWAFRNRKSVFMGLLITLAVPAAQALIWYTPGTPLGEIQMSFIAFICFVMNAVLLVLFLACSVAIVLYNFQKGIKIEWGQKEDEIQLLSTGSINISPDVMIHSLSENESYQDFAIRMKEAKENQHDGSWIVIIPFRHPVGMIVRKEREDEDFSGFSFLRDKPEYQGEDWPAESKIVAPGTRFESETWSEYLNYLNEFLNHYPEWAKMKKTQTVNPFESMFQSMQTVKKVTTIILLALLPFVSFAQKSARVSEYLGYRFETVKPTGQVRFIFDKVDLLRNGDGTKTYKQLLQDAVTYNDTDNAGKLVGITVEKMLVAPSEKEIREKPIQASTFEQPKNLFEGGAQSSIPDSVRFAMELEKVNSRLPIYKTAAWNFLKPGISFLIDLLWFLLPITIGLLSIFNLAGRSAAENGNLAPWVARTQIQMSSMAWIVSITQMVCLFLIATLYMFFWEWHPVIIAIIAIICVPVAKWMVNRVTPNGRYQKSTTTTTQTNFQQLKG